MIKHEQVLTYDIIFQMANTIPFKLFIILLLIFKASPTNSLRPVSDSILDIINTKAVEKIIAEKRSNTSQDEKRYLVQNDLEDEFEVVPDAEKDDLLYEQAPNINNLESVKSENSNTNSGNPRIPIDVLMKKNHSDPFRNTELLNELRGYNGRKVLKSSKSALLVTKKEYLRKDWCKTEPLIQKIKEEGCFTRSVINRFCYGQCNSFYIPKNPKRRTLRNGKMAFDDEDEDNDLNGAAFKSCAFCKPKKFTWITVTLRCPSLQPQLRKKRIQRIKQCKCIAETLD